MSKTGSLGTVLQGVSQQQPRVRLHGQVSEQVNCHSDVVQGLVSRPPVVDIAALTGTATDLKFSDITVDGVKYIIGYRAGVIKIWDTAGTSFVVNTQDNAITIASGGTFTNATKVLNKTAAFTNYTWVSGDTIHITGGTAVTPGDYVIASKTDADNIVLVVDITTDASSPTDVTAADAIAAYIGDNTKFHVYDDTIYISNPDVTVLADATIDSSTAQRGKGLIQCLGGSFGRDMVIRMEYADASVREVSHNVPDTDPDKVNGDYIMTQLAAGLPANAGNNNTWSGTFKGTSSVTRFKNVLLVEDSAETFTLTCTDGDDGKVLRSHINTAKDIETLIRFAPEGTLVKVDGEETSDDDFWMRFDVEDETTVGAGFGVNGTWRESVNVFEAVSLDLTTMPHIIYISSGEFYIERNAWQSRRIGDSDTNEHPSFVGQKITDINGFQSRLAFLAGPNFVASRSNIPSDFYKKSVVTESDTDPLDFASTTEDERALEWLVPFDRDMLAMSAKHQFIISGTTALTPKNASMVLTTDFEMAGQARPSSTGRTVLFPYLVGSHAGLKEFFSSDEIATNGADNVTETLSQYIDGDILEITTSTNFNTALVRTDHAASSKTLWVYKYLWEGIEKKQSSMSKWTFPLDVFYTFWDNETIYIIMRNGNDYVLGSMDMDFAVHAVGYTPTLDRQSDEVADGSFQVSLAYDNASFVQHTGCTTPGAEVSETTKTGSGPYVYTFAEATVPSGATVIAGLPYDQYFEPTMPFIRDFNGAVVPEATLVVTDFIVIYENSGTLASLMTSKYRADENHSNIKVITVGDVEDVLQIGIRSGKFNIPWGENSEWSALRITSTGVRPMAILEIEWRGQVYKRGK